jgi:glyoxylase-like metal-dependent hydrolase (beta-lactamase superfamily II)
LSHIHWDHVGAHEQFPNATFVVGNETQNLLFSESSDPVFRHPKTLPEDRSTRIRFLPPISDSSSWKPRGPFKATLDYFGDGSMYIIDAPGHLDGHINLVVRTGPSTYFYLAGDMCHDKRVLTGEKSLGTYCDHGVVKCFYVDREEALRTVKRANEFAETDGMNAKIIIAHDTSFFHDKGEMTSVFFPGHF